MALECDGVSGSRAGRSYCETYTFYLDHKRHSAVRIPVPPAGLRCPNPRPVARSGPRTVSGRADTPRLAAPDPFVPRLSGRCPARATASRRQARSTIESVGASSYGVPVRSPSILAHRTRRFQPTSPNDAVVFESTVALTSTRKHCYCEADRILSSRRRLRARRPGARCAHGRSRLFVPHAWSEFEAYGDAPA